MILRGRTACSTGRSFRDILGPLAGRSGQHRGNGPPIINGFTVDVDRAACTLRVSGELDPQTAATLLQAAEGVCRPLVVDLGETTFIDAGGLGALVRIQPSRLANVSERLRRVFLAGGLDCMLPVR